MIKMAMKKFLFDGKFFVLCLYTRLYNSVVLFTLIDFRILELHFDREGNNTQMKNFVAAASDVVVSMVLTETNGWQFASESTAQ